METLTRSIQQAAWEKSIVPLMALRQCDYCIHTCNQALSSFSGFSMADLQQQYLPNLFTPATRQTLLTYLQDPEFTGVVDDLEFQALTTSIPVDVSIAARLNMADGEMLILALRDLHKLHAAHKSLELKNWELSTYAKAALALTQAQDERDLMQRVCQALTDEARYCLAWVGYAETGENCPIAVQAIAGAAKAYLDEVFVSWSEQHPGGRGTSGRAIRSAQTEWMNDTLHDPDFAYWRERAWSYGIRSSIALPFKLSEGKSAVLVVYSAERDSFNAAIAYLFEQLTAELSHGLRAFAGRRQLELERQQRETMQAQLSLALTATIKAMAKTMESRDAYTSGHQERVALLAVAMARKLGWDEHRIRGLEMAAIVHDIGKIAVPIEVLTKPRRLSESEFALIKEHPETGFQILNEIPFPWPIAQIVLQHHEKLDGSGYPLGLHGEQILPEAQMLAVADIVESMASYRPYRPALGIDKALDEIRELSGSKLNAEMVACCLELFIVDQYQLPQHQV